MSGRGQTYERNKNCSIQKNIRPTFTSMTTNTSKNADAKPCPTFPGYAALPDGTILNASTGRPLTPHRHGTCAYWDVQPRIEGKQRRVRVHKMVLDAFSGPRPAGMECRHLDADKANNAASNLRWGTPRENYEDQVRHGTARGPAMKGTFGEAHPASKLTQGDVEEALLWLWLGEDQKTVARRFGISKSMVSLINIQRKWPHARPPLGMKLQRDAQATAKAA